MHVHICICLQCTFKHCSLLSQVVYYDYVSCLLLLFPLQQNNRFNFSPAWFSMYLFLFFSKCSNRSAKRLFVIFQTLRHIGFSFFPGGLPIQPSASLLSLDCWPPGCCSAVVLLPVFNPVSWISYLLLLLLTHLSVCLSIYLSTYLSTYLSVF